MSIQHAHDLRALGDSFGKIIDRGDEPQGSVLGLLRDAKDTIFAAADRLLALEQAAPENDPAFQKSIADPAPEPVPPGPDRFNQPAGDAHPPADHAEAAPGKGKEPAPAKPPGQAGGAGGGKERIER